MVHANVATAASPLLSRLVAEKPEGDIVSIEIDMDALLHLWEESSHWKDALNIWVNWLYSKRLPTRSSTHKILKDDREYETLMELYELAVYLEDTSFQNGVVNAIIERNKSSTTRFANDKRAHVLVGRYYEDCPNSEYSKLRSLLATLFADSATSATLNASQNKAWPEQFLHDVTTKLIGLTDGRELAREFLKKKEDLGGEHRLYDHLLTCAFHVHPEGSKCNGHDHVTPGNHASCRPCHPKKRKVSAAEGEEEEELWG